MVGDSGTRDARAILLVDDEQALTDLLAGIVREAGFTPLTAAEPRAAIEHFEERRPILAVIDLNLGRHDGFSLLADLRARTRQMPIIVLTARNSEDDKVRALDMGADDYVVKPFGHREILARVRAHARRALTGAADEPTDALVVGPLRLDPAERTLQLDGVSTRLTATEFRLLRYLMSRSDAVVPTGAIAQHVWGFDDQPAREVVRVTVHRLRRKLGDDGTRQRFIRTVPGVGLRLQSDS